MHILWVSQWFPPDLGALPARLTETARVWVEEGHEVTVVAAFPHHPLGRIPPEYRGRWFVEERYGGIRVLRCRLWALPNRRMWQRTLCQISFAVTSVLFALRRPKRPDAVIVSSPPFFTAAAGWAFARWHRAPLVFEVRDLWPAVFKEMGVMSDGLAYRLLERLEKGFYRAAAKVVVVTRSFAEDLAARGVPRDKIEFLPNGADCDFFRPGDADESLRAELGGKERFLAVYVGTHGLATGLEQVLDAAAVLLPERAFGFAFVGEGARKDRLREEATSRGLGNVSFHDAVSKERMPAVYAAGDVFVVCLRDIPIFSSFIPSKIFEILACGRPLVAALSGEAAGIVREAGGIVVPPGDGGAIAEALRKLRADPELLAAMGRRERDFVLANFDRRELARRYLRALSGLVKPAPGCA